MSDIAISIENVSKYFRLYASPKHRLKESLHPFKKQYHKKHWVFHDLNIEIKKGEFLGIIGRNGCGKSTLLKLISGVLVPSSGTIAVNGNISALLELGSGMNPELTGRENINFYGTILGIDQEEIEAKLDDIISFADIGEYIDQPIKRYSSGMKARLAFSVASHLTPDILIIDEVLAVGDIFFRQKCNKRIEQLLSEDITVLLVSHNLGDISRYCSRAIFLNNGSVLMDGDAKATTLFYQKYFRAPASAGKASWQKLSPPPDNPSVETPPDLYSYAPKWSLPFWPKDNSFINLDGKHNVGISWVRWKRIAICDSAGDSATTFSFGNWVHFYYEVEVLHELEVPFGFVRLVSAKNIIIHGKATYQNQHAHVLSCPIGCLLRFSQRIQLNLRPDQYIVEIGINMFAHDAFCQLNALSRSSILSSTKPLDHLENVSVLTLTDPPLGELGWRHLGVCDLPGDSRMALLSRQ